MSRLAGRHRGTRRQLQRIVGGLPAQQQASSRVRDVRLALERLDTGIEGILEMAAAVKPDGLDRTASS